MSGDAKQNVALVAGALGITGRKLVRHLDSLERWDVVDLRQRIVFEHDLLPYRLGEIAAWPFLEAILNIEDDNYFRYGEGA